MAKKVITNDERLANMITQLNKEYGDNTVMNLGDTNEMDVETISSGSIILDAQMGGGWAKGRVAEIYGPESSGKTTMALHLVAEAQAAGGKCMFLDVEHALDPVYAEAIGVDVGKLLISQPGSGEEALNIALKMIETNALAVVVIDSVSALTPKSELEGEIGDHHVGAQARLMSQSLRKMTGAVSNSGTICLFINQLREKIGVMFGSPETTSGGRALRFYSSQRLDIRRTGAIKRGEEVVGNSTRITVKKNKIAPPFKKAEFEIIYGEGISKVGELLQLGVANGLVDQAGAWFSYNGEQLGQGSEKAKDALRGDLTVAREIEAKLRTIYLGE